MKPKKMKRKMTVKKRKVSSVLHEPLVRRPVVSAKPLKTVKRVSALSKSDLTSYRKMLEEKRKDLMHEVEKRIREGTASEREEVMDSADQALDSYESELHFGINDNERKFLEDVEEALNRIQKGQFGICPSCGSPISKVRLKAMPSARLCIECKQSQERSRISQNV